MIKKKFLLLLAIILLASPAVSAQSISQDDLNSVYNDTVWYDPTGNISGSCAVSSSSGVGSLPSDIVAIINKLKPDYLKVSEETGVPWELLAGIHYRETSFSTTSSNIFQITGYSGPTDFHGQLTAAANFIKNNALSGNLPNHKAPLKTTGNDPEEIKDTIFSYNGRANFYAQQAAALGFDAASQPYEGSPYVMNNYDQKHQNMKIATQNNSGIDSIDTRFGAFTIYNLLGGSSLAGDCSGAVAGDAVQTAIKYAWPDHHAPNYFTMKASYQSVVAAAAANGEYVGGGDHPGIDCGGFITRVMRDSGVDPNYNQSNGPTSAQQNYMDSHPEKYQKLLNVAGTSDLQPGDIAINSEHTYMYVGSQAGFNGNSASASFSTSGNSWRAPMADNAYNFASFSWYRVIK